ncbi:MAG: SPFH domain-containing protein, partial [Myxococcota bacterium]
VTEPVLFHRALGSIRDADEKVGSLLVNATIAAFGRYDLSAVVSTTESSLRVDEIEREIVAAVNEVSSPKYGIRALHAGFQRISLPENNIEYVLDQMRAERREHAAKFRAEGQLEAARIRSTADLESAEILAKAAQEAAEIRGEAEAEAARIYAEAYSLDPRLYRFLRSLESIEKTLGERSTVTLRTDSEPFHLLLDPGRASTKPKRTPPDSENSRIRTSAPNYSDLREQKPEGRP